MDYKLDYMTRLFAKIGKKKTETYVISRIWHQLNDDRVKFVVQQYVRRTRGKYALADLYLPQLGIFIEINEPFHKNNTEIDRIRNEEISQVTHSAPIVIDCDNPMETVHARISEVVRAIRQAIAEKGGRFIPWEGDTTLSAAYHRRKGYLRADDHEYVRTIDEAFAIFGAQAKHRGFLRRAGAFIPGKEGEIVWCPDSGSRYWYNELSADRLEIREYNRDEQKRGRHLEKILAADERRVTFFREKDDLGFRFYRFTGVFELDKEKSREENKCVWKRISDFYRIQV